MKSNELFAAMIAIGLAGPVLAKDKPAAEAAKNEAKTAPDTRKEQPKTRPHSHLEDRHGIVAKPLPVAQTQPPKQPLHNHGKFHKQQ